MHCFFRVDEAWDFLPETERPVGLYVDVQEQAKALRFITSGRKIKSFLQAQADNLRPFTLTGSGDFHHLTALWLKQFHEPFTLISFDNHPDWDIRPPYWSCGAWINRALENPHIQGVQIWGCNNFECNHPWRLLGNRRAAREGRLQVYPWRQQGMRYPDWLQPVGPENWKEVFTDETRKLRGKKIYITIDMDCLCNEEAFTNWEQGKFWVSDLVEALTLLRKEAKIIGGDLCGAYSQPRYAGWFQKLAGYFDHPRIADQELHQGRMKNQRAYRVLWPALVKQ